MQDIYIYIFSRNPFGRLGLTTFGSSGGQLAIIWPWAGDPLTEGLSLSNGTNKIRYEF